MSRILSARITPFWQRMPRFFLFPLQGWSLLVIGAFALAMLLIPLLPNLIVLLGVLTGLVVFIRYAFEVLEQTAMGRLTVDQFDITNGHGEKDRPYQLAGILLLDGLLSGLAYNFNPFVGFIVTTLLQVALPASMLILAINGRFSRAIHPRDLWFVANRIGMPYLGLWGLLTLLSSSCMAAANLLSGIRSPWLLLALATFILLYFTLVMFNLIGYVAYQYHRELGMEVEVSFDDAQDGSARQAADAAEQKRAAIGQLVALGDWPAALDKAAALVAEQPAHTGHRLRWLKLLWLAQPKEAPHDMRPVMRQWLEQGQGAAAMDLFRFVRQLHADWQPDEVGQVVPLAQAAWNQKEPELAMGLLAHFDKRHPAHPDVPASFWLAAQIASEHYRKDDLARAFLTTLLQRFPSSPLCEDARRYQAVLDKLKPA
ncbi:tetratricopeptide repeat protein [Leeia aquatica]|uniref:Uncharacterized protein n=1 Tax=Leeia aquatica TaxID=2725557 RepID=A0A847S815_9NEIS|nr:hypothetical protein [Leeia aquatica]NLR75147.1 hypothetical protein [Leeia aquatica]